MAKDVKLTDKDFEIFKTECLYWLKEFEMSEWDIVFEQAYIAPTDNDHIIAQIPFDCISMTARAILNTKIPKELYSELNIREAGFHEICELLQGKLRILAEQRFNVKPESIDKEIHSIIHRLTKYIFHNEKTKGCGSNLTK